METIETHRTTSGSGECVQATFTLRGEGRGVEIERGAQEQRPAAGLPMGDDDHPDAAAEPGEVDDGDFEAEGGVGGGHDGKHRRIPAGSIDLAGVAAGSPTPAVGAGIEVTRIGIAPEFADEVQV
jgi:hypothetical protein